VLSEAFIILDLGCSTTRSPAPKMWQPEKSNTSCKDSNDVVWMCSFFIFWMPKHQVQLPSTRPGALDVTAQLSTRVLMHENAKLRPSPDIQENHHSSHRAGCSELLSVIAVMLHFDHIHGKNHTKQHATQCACLLFSWIHLSDSNIFLVAASVSPHQCEARASVDDG